MRQYLRICFVGLAALSLLLAGVLVIHAADIGGTTYGVDTPLSDGDTWGNGGNVTINGVTVDVPGSATVSFTSSGNRVLNGTTGGVFLNSGTFRHTTTSSGDNIDISGPIKFDNQGTFEFANGGDFRLVNANSAFENTGLILKSSGTNGSSNDPSFIFPNSTTQGGDFFNNGGTIQVDAGNLEIAGGRSNGGTFTTTGSGQIRFSGKWTELVGTATTGSTLYILGDNPAGTTGDKFVAADTTTIINMGVEGVTWIGDTIDTSTNVLQNEGLFKITGGTRTLTGGGTLLNASGGTLDMQSGTVTLDGGTAFENEGTLTFTSTNSKGFSGTGTVLNKSGATAEWEAGTITLATNATLKNEGTFDLTTTSTKTLSGSGTLENAASGTMNWDAGQLTLNNDLTNNGTFVFQYGDKTFGGASDFINNGTFTHSASGSDNIIGATSGAQFVNNGLFHFAEQGDFELRDGYTFLNNAGGIVRKTAGTSTESLFFHWGAGTTGGTFDNQGTVEVLRGEIEVRSDTGDFAAIVVPQYDAGTQTLTGGTWIVRDPDGSGSGWARLDLQPANAGIKTIGAGATVELDGVNAYFDQVVGDVTTVAGTLTINDRTFAAADFGSGEITLTGGTIDGSGQVILGDNVNASGTSAIGVSTLDLNGTRTFDIIDGTTTIDAAIQNGGLTKTGDGTLVFGGSVEGANTYSGTTNVMQGELHLTEKGRVNGDTVVHDGATLQLRSATGCIPDNADVTIHSGGLLDLWETEYIGGLYGEGTVDVQTDTGSYELRVRNGDFSGTITDTTGTFRLGKDINQGGTLILRGNNTYSGSTTIYENGGTLLVEGTHTGGGLYTVQSGGTLGGSGDIFAPVTVQSGATLSPGSSYGILEIGGGSNNVTLASGSSFLVEIGGATAGVGYDQLLYSGAGTLNIGGALLEVIGTPLASLEGETFFIVNSTNSSATLSGLFTDPLTSAALNDGDQFSSVSSGFQLTWRIDYSHPDSTDGNDVALTLLSVVPEPATALVWSLLAALAIGLGRRRRK